MFRVKEGGNSMFSNRVVAAGLGATFALFGGTAFADSIDPTSFSADLEVGESVTITKTVTVEEGGPSDALIDVFFSIDTSGSMGSAIANAKTAAGDIFTALGGFGDVAGGVGVYSEGASLANTPPGATINLDITTSSADVISAINAVTLGNPDGGGDFPERGQDAVAQISDNASWRPGSNRFIISLGDASWKNDVVSDADAIAALTDANVTLVGLRFSNFNIADSDSDDTNFAQSVEDLGGTVFAGGTSPADIVAAITAGITAGFSEYNSVTVDDLGEGLPEIDVSTVCLSADIGACNGAAAEGNYDRSVERTFEFEVTFTRLATGETSFFTYGLVDGGIVARESDRFGGDGGTPVIPLPAAGWLLLGGLGGLVAMKKKRAA